MVGAADGAHFKAVGAVDRMADGLDMMVYLRMEFLIGQRSVMDKVDRESMSMSVDTCS